MFYFFIQKNQRLRLNTQKNSKIGALPVIERPFWVWETGGLIGNRGKGRFILRLEKSACFFFGVSPGGKKKKGEAQLKTQIF